MVIGGHPDPAFRQVEIIDLSEKSQICPNGLPEYPYDYGSVGTFINDQPLVCGGHDDGSDYYRSCHTLDQQVYIIYLKL